VSSHFDRRQFIGAAALGMAGLALTAESRAETALAQNVKTPERTVMTYDIKPLPFDPTKIKGMSAVTVSRQATSPPRSGAISAASIAFSARLEA
jgi:hypothetical protein